MTPPVLGVIPARIASVRLPRKPLLPLAGRPLIEWVWRRAVSFGVFDEVVIATDSPEVLAAAGGFGARAVLTAPEHPSGTDRVAEVARMAPFTRFDRVVNVQGDEPFLGADAVHAALAALAALAGAAAGIGTAATPLHSAAEWRDPAVVKVVRGERGRALFFSRAPIPHLREGSPGEAEWQSELWLRHLGLYAYTREALLRWVALPEAPLERVERLEQLRPLAAGLPIGVGVVPAAELGGVDTLEDAARADLRLRQQPSTTTPAGA